MYQQQQTRLTADSGGSISNMASMISHGSASGIGNLDLAGIGVRTARMRFMLAEARFAIVDGMRW